MSSTFQSFVGVDLHQCTVTLAAVDPLGEKISQLKISTKSTGKIEEWLTALPRPVHLAVEACPFVEWFIDRFRPCVDRIDIADATELANRRGKRRKTDRNDSLDIAHRLARGECPLGFIAPAELMQLRKLGRHWRCLSRLLARSADTYWEIPSWAKLYPLALAALDQYAQQKYRQPLTALSDEQMIAILGGLEAGNLAEFPASADGTTLDQAVLFKTFRRHCIQGCLSAPRWGGNDQGSVWKALGYLQPATDLYPHQ